MSRIDFKITDGLRRIIDINNRNEELDKELDGIDTKTNQSRYLAIMDEILKLKQEKFDLLIDEIVRVDPKSNREMLVGALTTAYIDATQSAINLAANVCKSATVSALKKSITDNPESIKDILNDIVTQHKEIRDNLKNKSDSVMDDENIMKSVDAILNKYK